MRLKDRILTRFTRPVVTYMSQSRLPKLTGRLNLDGLTQEVTIQRDKWGIPHITAANRADLYFAQGVVHAQDRLWQMELSRRVATGTAAAVLGADALPLDRLTRTLGFNRLATQTWAKLNQQAKDDLQAYTAGVNAYLATNPPLSVEFRLLAYKPKSWGVLDSVTIGRLQGWVMNRGWSHELVRAQLHQAIGDEIAWELEPDYPAEHPSTLPKGIEINKRSLVSQAGAQLLGKGLADGAGLGSNGWVIAPERTTTGRAILANDVHLPLSTPGIWYHIHLQQTDGYNVTGVSMPGNPHVIIGHNNNIAWGITLSYADTEDLFIEKLNPNNPTQYEFKGEWQQAAVFEEQIEVKGSPTHTEKVVVTHHGPLIHTTLIESNEPIALQSTALQDNFSYAGLFALDEVTNWLQFKTAARFIDAPSLNLIYADGAGNIGYHMTGQVPVRAHGDGTLPVSGSDGQHEWTGVIPFKEMPHTLNPKQGYIVSCNHKIVGEDYPHYLGRCWMNGFRAQRLKQLITAQEKISPADCQAWQLDVYSLPAERFIAHLTELETDDPEAQISLDLLRNWDKQLTPHSSGAAVFQVLQRKLADTLIRPLLGDELTRKLLGEGPHPVLYGTTEFYGYWSANLLRMLGNVESHWFPAGIGREAILINALRDTTQELKKLLDPNPAQWSWGALHQVSFPHALSVQPALHETFGLGPFPIGGDTDTLMQSAVLPNDNYANDAFSVSYRQVIDFGDLSNSVGMHAPGQCGHLTSPHYADMVQPWLNGDYYKLHFTEEDVANAQRRTLTLTPK